MKIIEAKKHVFGYRLVAIGLMTLSVLLVTCGSLKAIYIASSGSSGGFLALNQAAQQGVHAIYIHTQFLSWIWALAPVPEVQSIRSPGSLAFLCLVCCAALARVMWSSASHLARRIKKVFLRVEEMGWEQEWLAQSGHDPHLKPDVRQLNIALEWRDQWFTRPSGLLFFALAVGTGLQWANLRFGLI